MLRSTSIATCFVLACLTGCGANATLADLRDIHLAVLVDRVLDGDADATTRPSQISIDLDYDVTSFMNAHSECAVIDGVGGTANGVSLELDAAGGNPDEVEIDGCVLPHLRTGTVFLGVGDTGHVLVDDGTAQIEADFAAPTFSPRMAKPVAPATWELAGNQDVAFTWSHPADLVGLTPADVVVQSHVGNDRDSLVITEVTATEIRAHVPATPPHVGAGTLMVQLLKHPPDSGDATSCFGAAKCNVYSNRIYEHTARISN